MAHEAGTALLETRPPSAAEGSHWCWCWQSLAGAEAKRLAHLAGPMVASCFLQNAVNVVSLMFVGHLGELHLAGASLAISVTSATGLNIIVRTRRAGHYSD
jgi:MATE family multidrug resistance protein